MKSYMECYPCFLRQAVEAGKIATNDEGIRWEILKEVTKKISSFSRDETPAMMGKEIHKIVRHLSKNGDPYKEVKAEYNQKAKELVPFIEKEIGNSTDKLQTILKVIAIANIIDFGPFGLNQVDFSGFVHKKLSADFKGNVTTKQFLKSLSQAKSILYVVDNCGEIVFDAYFINNFLMDKKIYLSVRGGVVLNDMARDDISSFSFNDNVEIIDNGDNAPGVILKCSSQKFNKIYDDVDFVILKGQGNYEGIGVPDRENVYSILVAKCPVIARHIGCNINDLVLTIPGKN